MLKETQRFNQAWLWAILGLVTLLLSYAKYKTYYLKESFGNQSPTESLFGFEDLIILSVILLFVFMRLQTEADDNEIRFRYLPFIFWWKRFPWSEITSAEVVNYDSLGEFLGWGIRYNFSTWAYNMSGSKGIRIQLKSGKRVLIGTQNDEAFKNHLDYIKAKFPNIGH